MARSVLVCPTTLMSQPSPLTRCQTLYQDRWLIVVSKPCAVLSHPNPSGKAQQAAFEGRYDLERKCFHSPAGVVWLVHRLDQDTSGVLVGALDAETARRCREAFESGRVTKQYIALVSGSPQPHGIWRDCLVVTRERNRVRTEVQRGGRPNAELHFRILRQNRDLRIAMLEIDLLTGRTHQIRVQAASRHFPVIGDDVYGDFALNRRLKKSAGIKRLCLHSHAIELPHPATGQALRVTAPVPGDMSAIA